MIGVRRKIKEAKCFDFVILQDKKLILLMMLAKELKRSTFVIKTNEGIAKDNLIQI